MKVFFKDNRSGKASELNELKLLSFRTYI